MNILNRSLRGSSFLNSLKKRTKIINKIQASKMISNLDDSLSIEYSLDNYHRSNQDTCLVHKPAVFEGQWVQSGDLLADCSASVGGELSLGQNILIAYMPWEGYNFEDAILISERLVYDDLYTSIHIERYEVEIRETKLGLEEITREIPDVPEESTQHLHRSGVAKLGSWIQEGDILVGKVTPINKKSQSNYQKLLYTILEKPVLPVRDSSLRAPKGIKAKIVGIQIFKQNKQALDTNLKTLQRSKPINASKKRTQKRNSLKEAANLGIRQNSFFKSDAFDQTYHPIQTCLSENKGNTLKKNHYQSFSLRSQLGSIEKKESSQRKNSEVSAFKLNGFVPGPGNCLSKTKEKGFKGALRSRFLKKSADKIASLTNNSNLLKTLKPNKREKGLLNGVTSIQVYLAEKRRIQVGDKMAGRHGNKGIISQILPPEDMPFLPDGTPLDMVLNPLGVPSRMNVGQIYECLLGLAGKHLGENFKVFPFDEIYGAEASRSFVYSKLYTARLKTGKHWLFNPNSPGKVRLYDGRTGESFDQAVTVGYAYMIRLVHMVDDKIHARSTGPYSLVTQQPLRGRSKQGGQRLGEMEVWALEGYGAAFTLLEMLTIKSDDMTGRMTLWSNLILNKEISIGTPESFKVLICELQALCLDIGLFRPNSI
jgi:DNA-directed RNA polymerase subunit beta